MISDVPDFLLSSYKAIILLSVATNTLHSICRYFGITFDLVGAPRRERLAGSTDEALVAHQINKDTTQDQVSRPWFTLHDIGYRLGVVGVAFAYTIITRPLSLTYYTYLYNTTHYGRVWGYLSVILLPFWPAVLFLKAVYSFITNKKTAFLTLNNCDDDNKDELDSMVFFTDNLPPLQSMLHDYLQMVMSYMANFYILGPSAIAIRTMYWDTELTDKFFWRNLLTEAGGRIPKELGVWKGNTFTMDKKAVEEVEEVLIKVTDSCLGIGDKFAVRGKDYESTEDLTKILEENYQGKTCVVMEVVKPLPRLGVHSLDILTARDPNGHVQLLDVIVWTGTNTRTSHAAKDAYMIDHRTGKTKAYCKWYNPNFANTSPNGLDVLYPEVAKAVTVVMEAHRQVPYPWMSVVGWDTMVTERGDMVFFEGNLAAWRCPRRLFLSLKNFIYFISHISWTSKS